MPQVQQEWAEAALNPLIVHKRDYDQDYKAQVALELIASFNQIVLLSNENSSFHTWTILSSSLKGQIKLPILK